MEHENAPVYFFKEDNVKDDWVKPDRAEFLSIFRGGKFERYPGYDEAVAAEDAWAKPLIEMAPETFTPVAPAPYKSCGLFDAMVPATPMQTQPPVQRIAADADGLYRPPPLPKGSGLGLRGGAACAIPWTSPRGLRILLRLLLVQGQRRTCLMT